MSVIITREHEIHCGHRVYGHEGSCRYIHGHQYKFELIVAARELDSLGRAIDFSVIKNLLCVWLDDYWDHKLLLWDQDPLADYLYTAPFPDAQMSVVKLPCNPTVENIAKYFVEDVAPKLLAWVPEVKLISVKLWETSKCSTTYVVKGENETEKCIQGRESVGRKE